VAMTMSDAGVDLVYEPPGAWNTTTLEEQQYQKTPDALLHEDEAADPKRPPSKISPHTPFHDQFLRGVQHALALSVQRHEKLVASGLDWNQLPPSERKPKLLLAAALTRALCYANRWQTDVTNVGVVRPSIRILVLAGCPDTPPQYISMMNAVFAAKDIGVVIDACMMGTDDSPFLQQAAYVTGGVCHKMRFPGALYQHLSTTFLLEPSQRQAIRSLGQDRVDLRAACFCHKRPVDEGYVCSVCLSIFCTPRATCGTCGVAFPANAATTAAKKSSKEKDHDGGG